MTARTLVVGLVGEATAEQLDVLGQLGDRLGVKVSVIDGCSALALLEDRDASGEISDQVDDVPEGNAEGRGDLAERVDRLWDRVFGRGSVDGGLSMSEAQMRLQEKLAGLVHEDLLSSVVGTPEGTSVAGPEGPATPFAGPGWWRLKPTPASFDAAVAQIRSDLEGAALLQRRTEQRILDLEERLDRMDRVGRLVGDSVRDRIERATRK